MASSRSHPVADEPSQSAYPALQARIELRPGERAVVFTTNHTGHEVAGVLADAAPPSLVPYDINGEVIRAFQLEPERDTGDVLLEAGGRWAGPERARALVELWEASDAAVRAIPPGVPGSTFAFPWFRYWVRPLVPDIEAIPEEDRAYYERFLVATFNNPARVDLNNDMLWNFLSVAQAREKKLAFDTHVLPPLDAAVAKAASLLADTKL